MRLEPTKRFGDSLKLLHPDVRRRAEAALIEVIQSRTAASRRFKKLSGSPYYTMRVNDGFRIVLEKIEGDAYRLLDVGNHDIIRRYG